MRSFLDRTREIEVNREITFEAADIKVALDQAGESIELPDVFIGATARVQNEPVVTRNPKHFERIEGVDTRSYSYDQ